MKHFYSLMAALSLAAVAQAQDFRPFRMGTVYQYNEASTPGDTTHTMRLESVTRVGTDSVFRFNGRAVALPRTSNCQRVVRPDNLFGATLTKRAGSEYVLTAANGRTFTLRPRAVLNQPWQAVAGGVTAQVTSRAAATVMGQADSVAVVVLSDGKSLRLSKRYGLLETPALGAYLNGQASRQLLLTALPTLHLGIEKTGPLAVYDYQPGDVFLRYSKIEGYQVGLCTEEWQRDSVLTRTVSANGDTVSYTIWSRNLTRARGAFPGAPAGMTCIGTAGTFLTAGGTYPLKVVRSSGMTDPATLTGALWSYTPPATSGQVTLASNYYRSSAYNSRTLSSDRLQQVCSGPVSADSVRMGDIIDGGRVRVFGNGLGVVRSNSSDILFYYSTTLLGYRKVNLPTSTGVEQWGSLRTFANILKAADYKPAATTAAFPNPFAQELTLTFEATRPQTATVQLYNALGQLVHTQQLATTAGLQQAQLQLPRLVAGLYTLHLSHDGRTEVLRLMRAE